jgi:hypothetical protein
MSTETDPENATPEVRTTVATAARMRGSRRYIGTSFSIAGQRNLFESTTRYLFQI